MLSINAVKFEFGSGFDGSQMKGSEHNDLFNANGSTRTNLQEAYKAELAMVWIFISGCKPVATIMQNKNH
jgi:chorismate synthase